MVPNIPFGPNQIGLFHYTSERNFPNFWHTGKHSQFPSKLNWDVILSQPGEAGSRCHTDLTCISFLFGLGNCVVIKKKYQKGILEGDVFGNHVIPVKLAGELSQPLDSLRMGCGDSFFFSKVCWRNKLVYPYIRWKRKARSPLFYKQHNKPFLCKKKVEKKVNPELYM